MSLDRQRTPRLRTEATPREETAPSRAIEARSRWLRLVPTGDDGAIGGQEETDASAEREYHPYGLLVW
jgi:hypothetical protein